jgi:hypothetical protein
MVNLEQIGVDSRRLLSGRRSWPARGTAARSSAAWCAYDRGAELKPGQEFNGGVVVDSAAGEALAVMPV